MDTISQVFTFLSLNYIISLIIASYIVIKSIQTTINNKISTVVKRLITFTVGLVLAGAYIEMDIIKIDSLIPSFFVAIVGYDYFIKQLLAKIEDKVNKKDAE